MGSQRFIDVGILTSDSIVFAFADDGVERTASFENGRIRYLDGLYDTLDFGPRPFLLRDVLIGIDFHWQRTQDQSFGGSLRIIAADSALTAVNHIDIEEYISSVISSEMRSMSDPELLKAHAVISRSWVISNLGRHGLYDVCADDHCQRYQGIANSGTGNVREAIAATRGEVLTFGGVLCDTRYSKCCGGTMELFSTCWEDTDPGYLQALPDTPSDGGCPFCDCEDTAVLSQVLNDYDLETRDFFRWRVRLPDAYLSELLLRRTGTDFGEVESLEDVERGPSGRIKLLRIKGSKCERTIGKELAIRRALSESHLKSSAFTIRREDGAFVLDGRGWGHGVGLCQIGAAVMAHQGYTYKEILSHYYPGTDISRI